MHVIDEELEIIVRYLLSNKFIFIRQGKNMN